MESSLLKKGHVLTATRLFNQSDFPDINAFDWLIVMGGPMGISDENIYPWLRSEKRFIEKAVAAGKIVLGICLGAQLIADVMGAKVYKNAFKEIGWFDIEATPDINQTLLGGVMPGPLEVFHWHGDTFDIPHGAVNIASSKACANQGFIVEDRTLALQFHLETTPESAAALIENGRHELDDSEFVQREKEMLADPGRFTRINEVMESVLKVLETKG
jgi:GMP synthase-like glutamine amidotransferase